MMRYLVMVLLLGPVLSADRIKMTSMGCPTVEPFEKVTQELMHDEIRLTQYAMANGCRILLPRDKIEVVGYDPRNEKSIFLQLIYKASGERLYTQRKNVHVEQPGRKNEFRF